MKAKTAIMTGILGLAGVAHFSRPDFFDAIVPPRLGNPRFWTYASGIAELGCAGLLANSGTRRFGGVASAALMVGVFPANIYTVVKHWDDPKGRTIALARLPLQIPLVWASAAIASDND